MNWLVKLFNIKNPKDTGVLMVGSHVLTDCGWGWVTGGCVHITLDPVAGTAKDTAKASRLLKNGGTYNVNIKDIISAEHTEK